jgi:hypothetical protein
MSLSQKPEEAAWRRSQTSDIPLRASRLARAVNIDNPDILQTTSGFNCAVCYMHPAQTIQFTNNEVVYSSTQCGPSSSLNHEFRTEWPPEGSLILHARPDMLCN